MIQENLKTSVPRKILAYGSWIFALYVLYIGFLLTYRSWSALYPDVGWLLFFGFLVSFPAVLVAWLMYKAMKAKGYAYPLMLFFLPVQFGICYYFFTYNSYVIRPFYFYVIPLQFVLILFDIFVYRRKDGIFRRIDIFFMANFVVSFAMVIFLSFFALFPALAVVHVFPIWTLINTIASIVAIVRAKDPESKHHAKWLLFFSVLMIVLSVVIFAVVSGAFYDFVTF